MRDYDAATQAALASGRIVRRYLFWITAPRISDDVMESAGFWNDVGRQSFTVKDGQSGANVTRVYTGSGTLISCDDIVLVNDLTIRGISIDLNQTDDAIDSYVRGYNLQGAAVEVHEMLFNPDTLMPVSVAETAWLGSVDESQINTGSIGDRGSITLRIASHSRQGTRFSAALRSHEYQQRRDPSDNGLKYQGPMGLKQHFWGELNGTATSGDAHGALFSDRSSALSRFR